MAHNLRPLKGEGTAAEALRLRPSAIRADHTVNARAAIYKVPDELRQFIGDRCLTSNAFCFTLEQVEARMNDMLEVNQQQSVNVYLTPQRFPVLVIGFLRHAAGLLAEARGLEFPDVGSCYLKADKIKQPRSPDDWAALASGAHSENASRLPPSPLDLAVVAARFLRTADPSQNADDLAGPWGYGWDRARVARRMGWSLATLDRHIRLLQLPMPIQAKVHRGEMTLLRAMNDGSKRGDIGTGPRNNVSISTLRANVRRGDAPEIDLSAADVLSLLRRQSGDVDAELSDAAKAWWEWSQRPKPEPEPKPAKEPRAKKPRKAKPKPEPTGEALAKAPRK